MRRRCVSAGADNPLNPARAVIITVTPELLLSAANALRIHGINVGRSSLLTDITNPCGRLLSFISMAKREGEYFRSLSTFT